MVFLFVFIFFNRNPTHSTNDKQTEEWKKIQTEKMELEQERKKFENKKQELENDKQDLFRQKQEFKEEKKNVRRQHKLDKKMLSQQKKMVESEKEWRVKPKNDLEPFSEAWVLEPGSNDGKLLFLPLGNYNIDKNLKKIEEKEAKFEQMLIKNQEQKKEVTDRENENKRKWIAHEIKRVRYQQMKKEIHKEKTLNKQEKEGILSSQRQVQRERKNHEMKIEILELQEEGEDKIDMVYTWGGVMKEMSIRNRYNYELQFSLRAVHKYLPWINKIYILANPDTDYPYWLKSQDEIGDKIVFLNRCQFFENPEHCPTYNSFAVYSIAHKIPGLSNKFILMDDDFFLNQAVGPDYFYNKEGLPIFYQPRHRMRTYSTKDRLYRTAKKRGFPLFKYSYYSHRLKPLRRDIIIRFNEYYPGFAEFVQSHHIRYHSLTEDMSVIYYEWLFQIRWMSTGKGERYGRFFQIPKKHDDDIQPEFDENYYILSSKDIVTFNCNDNWSKDHEIYLKQRSILWDFYTKLYPEVPDFEIPNPDHGQYS
ncbi:hypothetical protein M0812_19712 [Anaeramoeba flamelloides]|uniref:Stealth protein CR2 conserved region 2 domain-containing protein n=1 Tax=Anaeramoeba flamelloides TaxID=1746091 RepID=A0AAV7Z165_9EUKA|nr:hypothetical protein M0812_19712 [Anaeramoeba flamelloides]